jgi:hypothetical protein
LVKGLGIAGVFAATFTGAGKRAALLLRPGRPAFPDISRAGSTLCTLPARKI